MCQLCGGPLCPAFLLFDENYSSHDVFQWRKVLQWFQEAEAFIFVGTSFAVGATAEALQQAEARKLPCVSFNLVIPEAIRRKGRVSLLHILGPTSDTLPSFVAAMDEAKDLGEMGIMKRLRRSSHGDDAGPDDSGTDAAPLPT
jgi:NAD-dependent SIR2 family protein deacetylase